MKFALALVHQETVFPIPETLEIAFKLYADGQNHYICSPFAHPSWVLSSADADLWLSEAFQGPPSAVYKHLPSRNGTESFWLSLVDNTTLSAQDVLPSTPDGQSSIGWFATTLSASKTGLFRDISSIMRVQYAGGLPPAEDACSMEGDVADVDFTATFWFLQPKSNFNPARFLANGDWKASLASVIAVAVSLW